MPPTASHDGEPRADHSPPARSLREVRAERLLTVRELAALTGVAASTIYLTETGRTAPRPSVMKRLAASLGVGPLEIAEFRRAIEARKRLSTD